MRLYLILVQVMLREHMLCMKPTNKAGLHIGPTTPHQVTAHPCLDSPHPPPPLRFLNPQRHSALVWPKDVVHHLKDQTGRET